MLTNNTNPTHSLIGTGTIVILSNNYVGHIESTEEPPEADNFRDDIPSDQYENNIDGELDASSLLCINAYCVYISIGTYTCITYVLYNISIHDKEVVDQSITIYIAIYIYIPHYGYSYIH